MLAKPCKQVMLAMRTGDAADVESVLLSFQLDAKEQRCEQLMLAMRTSDAADVGRVLLSLQLAVNR